MENNKSAQEKMEEMIRKYKEEAMKFKERSGLYNEQVPAKEVALQPEKPPAITWREETESIINLNETHNTEASPTGPQFTEVREENGMREVEDILYATGPVSIEDIIKDSHFEQSSVPYSDVGQLQVEVTAATQSIPIPFADVLVLRKAVGEQELLQYLQTDDSGNTPVINLPAPSRELSEHPEPNTVRPYGVYTVMISHPEYYTTIIRDVQVFAGQRALLPVNLIPLSENATNTASSNIDITTDQHSLNE